MCGACAPCSPVNAVACAVCASGGYVAACACCAAACAGWNAGGGAELHGRTCWSPCRLVFRNNFDVQKPIVLDMTDGCCAGLVRARARPLTGAGPWPCLVGPCRRPRPLPVIRRITPTVCSSARATRRPPPPPSSQLRPRGALPARAVVLPVHPCGRPGEPLAAAARPPACHTPYYM